MSRILIIEDEIKIQEILTEFLRAYGYDTDSVYDGVEGLALFKQTKYDLVLLDIMMPKIDGFVTLELLRKDSDVPVIFITAMDDEDYQIKGFDLQADDYITKPFSMNLVIRRIEAVLRRKQTQIEAVSDTNIVAHGEVTLDAKACEVRLSGNAVPFTYKEYELLKLFMENKNRVFSRDDLLRIIMN